MKLDGIPIEVVNWRVTASGPDKDRAAGSIAATAGTPRGRRSVFLRGNPVEVPVYERRALAPGQTIEGPVIVEERETTVFVLPGWALNTDESGSLIALRNGEAA